MSGTTKYGDSSLYNNTGINNSGFGNCAGFNNLDASCNTAIGSNALFNNKSGPHNTAVGAGSMFYNFSGALNTAVGSSALEGTSTNIGDRNVAIGAQALYNSIGSDNTSLGTFSGFHDISGNYNTFLGYNTDVSNNGTNPYGIYQKSTALGYNAIIDASNQIVLGTSLEKVKIPGSYVSIGGNFNPNNPYPSDVGTYALDVSGNINAYYINLSSGTNYTSNPAGLVPKSYVDGTSSGLVPLAACECASTAYINLSNAPPSTIDDYTLQTGDRVLLNYQSNTTPNVANVANGIYVVNLTTSPYWTRSSDMASGSSAVKTSSFIENGTVNGGVQFIQIEDPATVGTNALLFSTFIRQIKAGRGLENVSGYFNVDTSLNFVNYLDNSVGPDNINVLNLGTNTNNIYIGKPSAFSQNKICVTQDSVGINNNTPDSDYVLDVSGILHFQSNIGEKIILYGNPGYSYGLGVQAGLLEMYVRDNLSRVGLGYLSSGNFVETLTVKVDKVGINNTTPSYNLDVSGNMRTTADALINGVKVGVGSGTYSNTNTAVGYAALFDNESGTYNTAIGSSSLTNNTTGSQNTGIGFQTLYNNTTGEYNTALGYQSLFDNTTGQYNTGIGRFALNNTTSGNQNTAIGNSALYQNTSGNQNTAIGVSALYNNTTANGNTSIGYQSLYSNTTGINNTAIGLESLYSNTTSNYNTAIGYYALRTNSTGSSNTAIGFQSLYSNTTGANNTAIGASSLTNNTTGDNNTAFGYGALQTNTTGENNTAIGKNALNNIQTASDNIAIGNNAGVDLSGNSTNNTFLGSETDVSSTLFVYNYSTALGSGATIDASNQIVLGTSTEKIKIPGTYVGIGGAYNPSLGFTLDVSGVLHINTNSDVTNTTNGLLIGGGGMAGYDVVDIHPPNVSGYWYFNKVGNFGFYNSGSKYELSTSGNASFTGTLGVGGTTTLSDTLTLNGSTGAKRQITASYLNLTDIGGGSGDIQIYQSGVNTLYDNNEDGGTHQFVVGNTTQYFPLLLNTSGAQISGNLQVSNEIVLLTTNSLIRMCGDATNNYIQSAASTSTAYKPLIFSQYGNASPTLYLDIQNYRVGIATNSPNYALDVNGNINFTGNLTQNGNPITGLTQWTTSGSNIYYNTGNVGIGKTPSYQLDVSGQIYSTGNIFSEISLYSNNLYLNGNGTNGYIRTVNSGTSTLFLGTNANPSTIQINQDGNVGIGTITPSATLDISGNTIIRGDLNLIRPQNTNGGAIQYNDVTSSSSGYFSQIYQTGTESGFVNQAPSGKTSFTLNNGSTTFNAVTISQSSGNPQVGIGNTSPAYTLDVSGNVNATSYNSTSDYRIKENITQLDNKFVVDKLNPVTYLNKKLEKQDIGLIAHELQEIYPELVNGVKDGEQFQSVNYIGLIPILIKEIQVLKERVKILEERN